MTRSASVHRSQPTALGTGLLAMDVVCADHSEEVPPCYAGGTCGNVLTILSYLGWKSSPVSRLAPGEVANRVLKDLRRWKVDTSFVSTEPGGSTPIIIHRIGRRSSGVPFHSFSWRCPACGAHFPGYKPVLATASQMLAEVLPDSQVFFVDRVSRGALQLAQAMSDRGALIVFEPSGISNATHFREMWHLSHIVKYSHERLREIADLALNESDREGVLLEIETLGAEGMRYKSRLPECTTKGWLTQPAFEVSELKDAAGSGDWCTAVLLDRVGRAGFKGLLKIGSAALREAIRYSQASASWNCRFEGARGGMYKVEVQAFRSQVNEILQGGEAPVHSIDTSNPTLERLLGSLCPSCKQSSFASLSKRRNGKGDHHAPVISRRPEEIPGPEVEVEPDEEVSAAKAAAERRRSGVRF
jgi:sugar/nucleoside kinase (ribokinase family)